MRYLYVGSFPPPYGGVTNKNEMLYAALSDEAVSIDRKKKKGAISDAMQLVHAVVSCRPLLIGLGSNRKLHILSSVLRLFAKRRMKNSIVFAMGGTLHRYAESNPEFGECLKMYRKVYVETQAMVDSLANQGLRSVALLPNCRKRPKREFETHRSSGKLRCVYFSLVSKEKGADIALGSAALLQDVDFDFWGRFDSDEYAKEFLSKASELKNVSYRGVFEANGENVYEVLTEYDLLLFPSVWKHEGVAGVLIEAKIAALPAIVSDNNFNSEIVEDSVEGIVLTQADSLNLTSAIRNLDNDRDFLYSLSRGAKKSAELYYLDSYIEDILQDIG
ncbi:glycosyltransferase [Slackia piriformis]|uniref:glycosyltransferase n=1 Tax=Slackia piriformis TaxID=626934 RepID=UPI0026DB126A|nr:glycosyltransferase [Slackia piriformis]MDO5023351.1 glycosyltransferase [Slackia piriformis]